MTKAEEILIDIEFTLDMYSAGADGAENALEKVREILKPVVSLTDDQQVVLEWLKENGNPNEPFSALDELTGEVFYTEGFKTCIYVAFNNLTGKQQFQVLAAFAEWGIKEGNQ